MAQPSRALLTTIRIIDTFTDLTGTVVSWLAIPLVGGVAYEVSRATSSTRRPSGPSI